jgi:hypothetical protein
LADEEKDWSPRLKSIYGQLEELALAWKELKWHDGQRIMSLSAILKPPHLWIEMVMHRTDLHLKDKRILYINFNGSYNSFFL